jgi:tetratricopeptide (TPR) repeat protein
VKTAKQISARARILQTLARLKLEQGNTALAAQILDEVVVFQRLAWGERNGKLTNGLIESARLHAELGRVDQALGQVGEALSIARETGNKVEEMHSLRAFADIEEDAGRNEAALANRRECEELGRENAPALVTWLDDLSTLSLLLSKMNQHGEAMEKVLSLSKAIEDNSDAFTADRDKAITIHAGMIKVAESAQKASGRPDYAADLVKWRQRLAELRALVP